MSWGIATYYLLTSLLLCGEAPPCWNIISILNLFVFFSITSVWSHFPTYPDTILKLSFAQWIEVQYLCPNINFLWILDVSLPKNMRVCCILVPTILSPVNWYTISISSPHKNGNLKKIRDKCSRIVGDSLTFRPFVFLPG